MIMNRFFVTGVNGQLGHDVMNELIDRGYEAVGSDITEAYSGIDDGSAVTRAPYRKLDITDASSVSRLLKEVRPDHIIHCAAWTAVDAAEDEANIPKVTAVNADGTGNIAKAARELDAVMTYISTDYVFNGQHTIEIVALVSGSRETPVWCMIYDDLAYEHEADIFANQMKYVKPLLPYETFIANIEAGSDKHLIIKDLVESYDLTVTPGSAPGGICAIATVERIYDKYGYHILDQTLRMIVGTWEGEAYSLSANMLSGVARIIFAYGDSLKEDIFKEKLSRISPREISRTARERKAGSLGYAETLIINYNKNRKTTLSFEKLYTHKTPTKKQKLEEELAKAKEDDPEL